MKITFDPAKNARNIVERGLSFDLVADLEWDTAIAVEDTRKDYGERRLRVLGRLNGRLHIAVIPIVGMRRTSSASARRTRKR